MATLGLIDRVRRKLVGEQPELQQFSGMFPFFNILELVVREMTEIENVRFLQIGSADGCTEDPISDLVRRYKWQGTLVEPSPRSFAKLKKTYGSYSGLRFEQCLLTDEDNVDEATLYEVSEQFREISHWADQSSSMNRDIVFGFLHYFSTTKEGESLPPDLNDAIEEVRLPAYHIAEFIRQLEIEELDLMVVDTMGYDARLLHAFPFDEIRPKIIMFEHFVISPAEKQLVLAHLANQGYSFVKFAVDTIAIQSTKLRLWQVSEW